MNDLTGSAGSPDDQFSRDVTGLAPASPPEVVALGHGDRFAFRIGPVAKHIGEDVVWMLAYGGSIPGPVLHVARHRGEHSERWVTGDQVGMFRRRFWWSLLLNLSIIVTAQMSVQDGTGRYQRYKKVSRRTSGEGAMKFEITVEIDAPPERVWDVMSDVERWPQWTASVSRAQRLDDGPLRVGSRARLKQPKFPPAVWEVTDIEPGRSFSWTNKSVGVTSVGHHRVVPRAGGGATVNLALHQSGPLAPLLGLLMGKLSRRYVETEAQGLKSRSERQDG